MRVSMAGSTNKLRFLWRRLWDIIYKEEICTNFSKNMKIAFKRTAYKQAQRRQLFKNSEKTALPIDKVGDVCYILFNIPPR